ncbi:MAG: hypothetical protein AAF549_05025 [Pseudomonadota bacterium]
MRFFVFIVLTLLPCFAHAQNTENNIEQRITITPRTPLIDIMREDEPLLTGREDLILLIRPKLFTAYITPSIQYTDNAFLNDQNKENDLITNLKAGIQFDTIIDNRINFFSGLSISAAQYQDNSSLDYSFIEGSVGGQINIHSLFATLSYLPVVIYEDLFEDQIVALHRLNLVIEKPFLLDNGFFISPFISGQLTPSDPADFGYQQITGGIQAIKRWDQFLFSASASVYQKDYFDYFEDITNESREDRGMTVSTSLQYTYREGITLSASLNFTDNNSSLTQNDYQTITVTPQVRFSFKF